MSIRNTYQLARELESAGMLVKIQSEVDPDLEMAEIHRRINARGGPAILFENIKGSNYKALSNIYGTRERAFFIFRKTLKKVSAIVKRKADPSLIFKKPFETLSLLPLSLSAIPHRKFWNSSLHEISLSEIPQVKSWPKDGGPFITLPQVYSEYPGSRSVFQSNLGMYRIQMAGNAYRPDQDIGLHYQIHRGIGVHHHAAVQKNQKLPVSVFIGGPPAAAFAAVMPLPEGLPEILFAGLLGGRGFRFFREGDSTIASDADFVITGEIDPAETLPEGPFGDHLGYYSLQHEFPVMRVKKVYARKNAVWPFTVVGRPPQEDSIFGELIHEITGPMVPVSIPGLKHVHAVDTSGVHPLLLAIGSERYVPYGKRKPMELMTIANAILGFNQMSLAKYLFICAEEDNPALDIHAIDKFFIHIFERLDFHRNLHFHTNTTMDTLDYSGTSLNSGSKLVIAVAGEKRRELAREWQFSTPPTGFTKPQMILPGIFALQSRAFQNYKTAAREIEKLEQFLFSKKSKMKKASPETALIILTEDSEFCAANLANFIWVTFTRSNPSHDIYGAGSFTEFKHWGCHGPLIIDARRKAHHAPPLIEDKKVSTRVDRLFARNGELAEFG